ncbi:MAG: hypothetical protein K8U57_03440 [Planctomycetes bacterium]|nr:hypothetical protein [Planctomycetota bacterium]
MDDSTEVLALQNERVATPESSFAEILRRAFRHGKRSQGEFNLWTFDEIESELRAGWVLNGEMTDWHKVRGYVQMGFEHGRKEPQQHRR